jgi:hypothetical protein
MLIHLSRNGEENVAVAKAKAISYKLPRAIIHYSRVDINCTKGTELASGPDRRS